MKNITDILNGLLEESYKNKSLQIENANKNDENYKAVLNLLEREKEEKNKSENLLEENRKTLVVASNIIKDLLNTTFKTEIGRESLKTLSDVSRTFENYVEEKKVEKELRGKLEETVKELKAKEVSLTSWKRWFWGVTIILALVIVIMCVAR